MKTIRLVIVLLGIGFFGVAAWLYAAWFALPASHSWGGALVDSAFIPAVGFAAGLALSWTPSWLKKKVVPAILVSWLLAFGLFLWATFSNPPNLFWVIVSGIFLFTSIEALCAAELFKEDMRPGKRQKRMVLPKDHDPSLN